MKKLLFFLQILLFTFYSCQKKDQPSYVSKSPDLKKGEAFLNHQNDSAFYYFNKVATLSKDSLQIAMAYNNMGVIQSGAGDYFGAQESLLQSLKFLDEQDTSHRRCLAADYNELGLNSTRLQNYDAALSYYDAALKFTDRKEFKLVILNNKALAHQKKETYTDALKIYRSILTQIPKGGIEYARILSNVAKTKWLQDPSYNAVPELLTALHIREKNNDLWGQNASYYHLADYYTTGKPDSALFYAQKMYTVAQRLGNPDDVIRALQKLIILSPSHSVSRYFKRYQHMRDSIESARIADKNQFALIRYEVQKNKADNLKLQKDNTEKKYKIIRQNIILFIIIVLVFAGAVVAVIWYRKRKQLLEMEAQNFVRESQLRTSQKIHDVVANGLYRIMNEVEYQDELDKEQLLDKIEVLYEQSRDISYEKPMSTTHDFHGKVHALLNSFSGKDNKFVVAGNNGELWKGLTEEQLHEIEHILLELMINMSKHSKSTRVAVKFQRKEERICISYTDNGVGLPSDFKYGNGLTNTGNRIKKLRGNLSFDSESRRGLKIQISFPIT